MRRFRKQFYFYFLLTVHLSLAGCGAGFCPGMQGCPASAIVGSASSIINDDGSITVTINGSGFAAGMSVTVDLGTVCTPVTIVSATVATCIVPAGTITPIFNVGITLPGGGGSGGGGGGGGLTLTSIGITQGATHIPISTGVLKTGKSAYVNAMATFSDMSQQDLTSSVTFSSQDTAIAVTGVSGGLPYVHGITVGSTVIAATYNGTQYLTNVTVGPGTFGSVVCTELHRQKLISDLIFNADEEFGKKLDPETLKNYRAWGTPLASLMRRSRVVTWIMRPLGTAWAYEMAYEVGAQPVPNLLGKFLFKYGLPVSNALGKTIRTIHSLFGAQDSDDG